MAQTAKEGGNPIERAVCINATEAGQAGHLRVVAARHHLATGEVEFLE